MQEYYTREQVAAHNTEKSAWIIIDTAVFDITKFAGNNLLTSHASWRRVITTRIRR